MAGVVVVTAYKQTAYCALVGMWGISPVPQRFHGGPDLLVVLQQRVHTVMIMSKL